MVYSPLLKDFNSVGVFRVGSERQVYPDDYVVQTILPLQAKQDGWMTLNIYAQELVESNNPAPLPQPFQQVQNTGYRNTQIRALVSIDNEQVLVGIGAGIRMSVPSNADVSIAIAVPAVPRNVYPFPLWGNNPSGVIIQSAGQFPAYATSPFPMPFAGLDEVTLPAYTTVISAFATPCKPPVAGRHARLSQEIFTRDIGVPRLPLGQIIPIPSRAVKVSIYDAEDNNNQLPNPTFPAYYSAFQRAYFIENDNFAPSLDGPVIATLYNQTMVHDFTIPTNATHLLVLGQVGDEVIEPAKLNVTWTLEI